MLYQDIPLGQRGFMARFTAHLVQALAARRRTELDLTSLNAHLRRDLGLTDGQFGMVVCDPWRK